MKGRLVINIKEFALQVSVSGESWAQVLCSRGNDVRCTIFIVDSDDGPRLRKSRKMTEEHPFTVRLSGFAPRWW